MMSSICNTSFTKTPNNSQPSNNTSGPPPNRTMQTKKLTWEEMEEHRKKGLCYNYDEKFFFGHCCTQQKLHLLDANAPSEEEYESATEEATEEVLDEETLVISYSALSRITTPQTMKVKGFFKKQILIILLDLGSTHNFIDPQVAKAIDSYIHPTNNFKVMVGNGKKIACKGTCQNVKLSMGQYTLKSDMYILPLEGCDIVLGIQWLRTLGTIQWNFAELWMTFKISKQEHTLIGLQVGPSQIVISHCMEKILQKMGKWMLA